MKICHTSDTHGYNWPDIPDECSFVIHSGDGLPNASKGDRSIQIPFQTKWVRENVEKYRQWLKGKPLLYCCGNHCFIDPCKVLREHGIDAIDLTNKVVVHQDIVFYGFPFIPYIDGKWNYENIYQR